MSKVIIGKRTRAKGVALEQGGENRLDELTDEQLMRLVVSGDDEAFDLVYLRYKTKLLKFIKGFVADDAAAEDLLQEAFLRVYRNADKYEPEHKFSSWLFRIAANLCLNELRRRRTHPLISLNQQVQVSITDSESESVELHELIPDAYFAAPGDAAESAETREQIAAALETLSTIHRDVISMRLFDDLNYEQIAEILRCSVGTVKSRAFYGIRALRGKLESEE